MKKIVTADSNTFRAFDSRNSDLATWNLVSRSNGNYNDVINAFHCSQLYFLSYSQQIKLLFNTFEISNNLSEL